VRRAANIDVNHREIVEALRGVPGLTVLSLARVGSGCPDLLVGVRGRNYLLEVKRPPSPRGGLSASALTPGQLSWHRDWKGQVAVIRSVDDALVAIGLASNPTAT